MSRPPARAALAAAGYAAARLALAATRRWSDRGRINFRGREVSLAGGPALAVAASASAAIGAVHARRGDLAAASLLAGLAAGAVGRYDDLKGGEITSGAAGVAAAKGLHGHLVALRHGQVSTGVVKIVVLGAAGLVAAAALPRHRGPDRPGRGHGGWAGRTIEVALGAGLIAGLANLVNLLDLRPGRALKVGLMVAVPIVVAGGPRRAAAAGTAVSAAVVAGSALAGPVGASVALLPDDLSERLMLGDAGANALGAVLGLALADRIGPVGRGLVLAAVVAATVASERVSFTEVIEATPVLRQWDRIGRA